MEIATATTSDAEVLTDLHLDVWEEAYAGLVPAALLADRRRQRAERVERWRAIIADPGSTELLARDDGRLVGFVSCGDPREPDEAGARPEVEVRALYVRANVHGTGVGRALLEAAIGAGDAYLWVLDRNEQAIGFYRRRGFVLDGETKLASVGLERRMVRRTS